MSSVWPLSLFSRLTHLKTSVNRGRKPCSAPPGRAVCLPPAGSLALGPTPTNALGRCIVTAVDFPISSTQLTVLRTGTSSYPPWYPTASTAGPGGGGARMFAGELHEAATAEPVRSATGLAGTSSSQKGSLGPASLPKPASY